MLEVVGASWSQASVALHAAMTHEQRRRCEIGMGGLQHTDKREATPLGRGAGHDGRVGRTNVVRGAVLALLCGSGVLGAVVPAHGGRVHEAASSAAVSAAATHAKNVECIECHTAIGAEWAGSQHRSSFVDESFTRAHAIEPLAFCRRCHAPTTSARRMPSELAADMGVACTSCHVIDGALHAAPGNGDGPHALVRTAAFANADACARCHEFDFPDSSLRTTPEPMQLTIAEHAESPFAAIACATCHMPWRGEGETLHRSHEFSASRDPAMVRSAVIVDASRTSATTVEVALAPGIVGHAFPTGDLFRRVAVYAQRIGAEPTRPRTRYLSRHFARVQDRPGIIVRKAVTDDRVGVGEGPRIVQIEVPGAAEQPIAWWVVYERVGHPRGPDERAAFVEGSIAIAGGMLPSTTPASVPHNERAAP